MKKLQVPVDDELMKALKLHALDNDSTLKEVVTKALNLYLNLNDTEKELPHVKTRRTY